MAEIVQSTTSLQAELAMWESLVSAALTAGQSYVIDGRSMQRVSVETATKRIDFLRRRLSTRLSRNFVHARAVPR